MKPIAAHTGLVFGFLAAMLLIVSEVSAQPGHAQPDDEQRSQVKDLRSEIAELQKQLESRSVQPGNLLAPPVDPQRLVRDPVRAGEFRGAFLIPGTDVSLRIGGYARGDAMYDTGFVGSGLLLFPSVVTLDGSPLAARRGRTQLTGSQSRLNFDAQAKTDLGRLRGFAEIDFLQDRTNPRLRHAFGEWKFDESDLIGGMTWSTFMDPAALPQTVPETSAAGAIFRRQAQIRYTQRVTDCFNFSVAIEEPTSDDFTFPAPLTDQPLERWPDFVGRIRFEDAEIGTFQIAALVRSLGFEDVTGDEHLRAGWGVSATLRLILCETDTLSLGVVGGRGIGGYLVGLGGDLSAAGPDTGGFRTLGAIGAYAAHQHRWTEQIKTNAYYGFSNAQSTSLMAPTAGDIIHNGGVNFIWSPRPGFGIGIEWSYALREVRNGTTGDNHRVQFAVQFGP